MSKLPVHKIKHVLNDDIDTTQQVDVNDIDLHVYRCIEAAKDALRSSLPSGYSEFERDQLLNVVDGLRHSHASIRKLLSGKQSPMAVDALAISRLQLETLYNFCFLVQSPENVRLFLKNGWKKKYVRFLLEREECVNLPRFENFLQILSQPALDGLQRLSSVSDEERRTIEMDELGPPFGPMPTRVIIGNFPTPMKVIEKLDSAPQGRMLKRLYPEYQFLCSFAHGDSESILLRIVSNDRSVASQVMSTGEIKDVYQRQVLEPPVVYSALSSIQVATEVAAMYPNEIELLAKLAKAWMFLLKAQLLARPIWDLRAKHVLPVIL
jgi:hypothetical protein